MAFTHAQNQPPRSTQQNSQASGGKHLNTEELANLLYQDLGDLDALETLLSDEKTALEKKDNETIARTTREKSSLLQQIETRAKLKAKLLATSGLKIRPGHVSEALATLGDDRLYELWTNSLVRLKKCKEQNLINGKIISHSLSRTTKLMSIIRGQNNAPNLYGNKGKSTNYTQTQVLGKA